MIRLNRNLHFKDRRGNPAEGKGSKNLVKLSEAPRTITVRDLTRIPTLWYTSFSYTFLIVYICILRLS